MQHPQRIEMFDQVFLTSYIVAPFQPKLRISVMQSEFIQGFEHFSLIHIIIPIRYTTPILILNVRQLELKNRQNFVQPSFKNRKSKITLHFLLAFLYNNHIELAIFISFGRLVNPLEKIYFTQGSFDLLVKLFIDSNLCNDESPKHGKFPNGSFYSSQKFEKELFTKEKKIFEINSWSKKICNSCMHWYPPIFQTGGTIENFISAGNDINVKDSDSDLILGPRKKQNHNWYIQISKNYQDFYSLNQKILSSYEVSRGCKKCLMRESKVTSMTFVFQSHKKWFWQLNCLCHDANKRLDQTILVETRSLSYPLICIDNFNFE
ncbi:hypothetical protein VP01_275g4 [Puccinia sorghi]|uniref:Uncharacterized protein n=1 Tax=Puccinia sorghi TaxID=27349 RepID=A0A0L6V2Y4_9BASI|nr:hypothetical protein VP01_275g4 [Puccinia sorghi]